MRNKQYQRVYLPDVVGRGYKRFWNFKGRYRIVKGGRGSKKSCTAALWFVYHMMYYWHNNGLCANTLVIRRYFNTHRDSTFAQLKWAIKRLNVGHLWKATTSPMELTYIPSGGKIMFRGLDDPQSITSITAEEGYLCWAWWEEAFQVGNEDDFDKVDMSIRGDVPAPLFKQHTLTFNPWSENIWLKERFYDNSDKDGLSDDGRTLALTKNYDCNEFLGADDIAIFADMQKNNPRRYNIEGLGNWGIAEGLVFDNWQELEFDEVALKRKLDRNQNPVYVQLHGLDFGFTHDPTAFIALLASEKDKEIYIYNEFYKTGMLNTDIKNQLRYMGFDKARIIADNLPIQIAGLREEQGIRRIYPARKGKGSIEAGIQKLRDYKIYVHPRCVNTLVELNNYVFAKDSGTGKPSNKPIDEFNHLMDALRYATEGLKRPNFSW